MYGRRSASPQRSTSALEESNRTRNSPSRSDDERSFTVSTRPIQGADRVHPDNAETGPATYRGLRGWPPIGPLGSDATGFDRHHLDEFSKPYSPREDRPPLDPRQTIDDGFEPEPTLPASRFPPPEIPDSSNPSAIHWASGGAAPFTHQFDHNMSGQAGASTSGNVPPSLFTQSESIPTVGPTTGIDVDFQFDNWSNMIYTGGGLLCDQELMNAIASFQVGIDWLLTSFLGRSRADPVIRSMPSRSRRSPPSSRTSLAQADRVLRRMINLPAGKGTTIPS